MTFFNGTFNFDIEPAHTNVFISLVLRLLEKKIGNTLVKSCISYFDPKLIIGCELGLRTWEASGVGFKMWVR